MIKSLVKCYVVKAEIKNVKTRKRIRASIFKKAEEFNARYYPQDESQSICYDGEDLKVKLLFTVEGKAAEFRTFLSQWSYNNPLIASGLAISVEQSLDQIYVENCRLKCVLLSNYDATETDSPLLSLAEFEGHISSCSNLSAISVNDPMFKYQGIEKADIDEFRCFKPYVLHIKPKAKFPTLKNEKNNMIYGSWTPLHQMFDGLNTIDGIPLVAIKPIMQDSFESKMFEDPMVQKLYKVNIELEFRNTMNASLMGCRLKDGSTKMTETVWRSFIYVENPKLYCSNLQWKWEDTKEKWQTLDED